jgi:hypothetical protein
MVSVPASGNVLCREYPLSLGWPTSISARFKTKNVQVLRAAHTFIVHKVRGIVYNKHLLLDSNIFIIHACSVVAV